MKRTVRSLPAVRDPSRFQIWHGRDEPPAATRELRAGAVTAVLDGIDLRYVRFGGVEVVRRLFVAVRDAAWGTIPPHVSELEVEEGSHGFRVSFAAAHAAGEISFRWRGEYTSSSDGSLSCQMAGVAESDFQYNRIGFCVLHPREQAGRRYRARSRDGEISGELPDTIGPQRSAGGTLHPLFPSYERLDVEVEDGLWAGFTFEGDLFEMEDQRNWTDASFKTYSTPITQGWPHAAKRGTTIFQSVQLSFSGKAPALPVRKTSIEIELGAPRRELLPPFGVGLTREAAPLTSRELELIEAIRVDHIRVELDLSNGWRSILERASDAALSLGAKLELALFLGKDPESELEQLADALPLAQAGVVRFLVLKPGQKVTGARAVRLARAQLASTAPHAAFACGTNQWFTELNRERPDVEGADAITYSICATVHADDDRSVAETPAAQGDTVRSALAAFGRPVCVSPVTFRPRYWPFGELKGYLGLPYDVDPRQGALFGAAWTTASAKYLLEAGVSSMTYFETTGPGGIVADENGSAQSAFEARPGHAFPLYHILADLGDWRQAVLLPSRSSEPLSLESLAVRTERGTHVLVCNLTPEVQDCAMKLPGSRVALRVLDEESAARAGEDPASFRMEQSSAAGAKAGQLEFQLQPYAVVRVDAV